MKFSKTHEWVEIDEAGKVAKIGISKKALSELGEIVFIQLPKEGQILSDDEPMAVVESTKAAIDIYSPVQGRVCKINTDLVENVEILNSDPQGRGWLCEVELETPFSDEHLMSPACYAEL
ncbi:glycine cleavage system protein H [Candidatus Aerophobetes bacterium]|uniref:Glycine cleavage system protein H n=1 Tax=Aerophobetes bacterium TaxID=2030807 RepID=A0A2A4X6U7_UNCAE|nr:MAG: glycine cleavage system protein H [Candidatus Aerophobetes bacterium]